MKDNNPVCPMCAKPVIEPISVPTESRPTAAEWLEREYPEIDYPLKRVLKRDYGIDILQLLEAYAASSSLLPVPSPLVDALQHGMNCPGLTPTRKDECTCGFEWRIRLRTEQEMHRAWKKRAEEAELELQTQTGLPVGRQPSYISELRLEGKGTDHIWLMEDGAEPHTIGIRLDSGDSGVVYVTPNQAKDLAEQLTAITSVASLPVGESPPKIK